MDIIDRIMVDLLSYNCHAKFIMTDMYDSFKIDEKWLKVKMSWEIEVLVIEAVSSLDPSKRII